MNESILKRLRELSVEERLGSLPKASDRQVLEEWLLSGVGFAAAGGPLEDAYYRALRKLFDCIAPMVDESPVLFEGGGYSGCWMESTGTINSELLSRFVPSVARESFLLFARYQKEDGQLPYKVTAAGPAYRQIQMVTPLARSVWNHHELNGRDDGFLRTMYEAMARYDEWLAAYRNTRGSGCVEAFCTFDTGHDLSPRFWHVPDTCHQDDARQVNPDSPLAPYLAPDLTANVYCQRLYLARMARWLGEAGADGGGEEKAEEWKGKAEEWEGKAAEWESKAREWESKAGETLESLYRWCFDETDWFFYDRDRQNRFVRIQSDVLLRVLACEVGDREFFDGMLERYLLNTRKFFAKYPFTSIAMDDPRFDPFSGYNSWGGTSNFLSLIRAPHAFEHHGRFVELTWVLNPIVSALTRMDRFPQTLSPWTGEAGFTETYSPSILCLLDYVERLCGIMPRPDGELWFTACLPYPQDHGGTVAAETAYRRRVDGVLYEWTVTVEGGTAYRNGEPLLSIPAGTRAVTDRQGKLKRVVGMSVRPVEGHVRCQGMELPLAIEGNEQLELSEEGLVRVLKPGIVFPAYG
ncbi:MGH1-like glycoside hydrolase domain-containing protein [Paenibacillus sp. YN15]|uniref:MGH1-like glycoside hydrolase domain-containing protein n=1 Tax=Paenibacillus sp. YN15 TaxID=1742774 RepID=UPI000DCCF5AB|nr:hypothetical protein [Paenibacillus sp. YN15]RAU97101.1 hypothetical protein DQG13_19205 [Paenibacillus sp. YN15]